MTGSGRVSGRVSERVSLHTLTHPEPGGITHSKSSVRGCAVRRAHGVVLLLHSHSLTLQVEGQVHDVSQVVVAMNVGIVIGRTQVLLDASDDDVRIHSQDGDEGRVRVREESLDRVEELEDAVLLAAVQAVHHHHQPRLVPREHVHVGDHLGHQVHFLLQPLHKAVHLQRVQLVSGGQHPRLLRDVHGGDGLPPCVKVAHDGESHDTSQGDEDRVHGAVVNVEHHQQHNTCHQAQAHEDNQEEVGDAADRLESPGRRGICSGKTRCELTLPIFTKSTTNLLRLHQLVKTIIV